MTSIQSMAAASPIYRIIQEFMKKAEAAREAAVFPVDMDFALRVANQTNALKARSTP